MKAERVCASCLNGTKYWKCFDSKHCGNVCVCSRVKIPDLGNGQSKADLTPNSSLVTFKQHTVGNQAEVVRDSVQTITNQSCLKSLPSQVQEVLVQHLDQIQPTPGTVGEQVLRKQHWRSWNRSHWLIPFQMAQVTDDCVKVWQDEHRLSYWWARLSVSSLTHILTGIRHQNDLDRDLEDDDGHASEEVWEAVLEFGLWYPIRPDHPVITILALHLSCGGSPDAW